MNLRRRARVVAVWGLVVAAAMAGRAQDDESFRKGLDSYRGEKWTEVVTFMEAAIKAQPNESAETTTRGGFLGVGSQDYPYIPHYFQGEAYFRQENCARAIEKWETSETQGVVAGTKYIKTLREGYRSCAERGILPPPEFTAASAAARQAYDEAMAAGRRVDDLLTRNAKTVSDGMRQRRQAAQKQLEAANRSLASALTTRRRSEFDEARDAATAAKASLNPLETEIEALANRVSAVEQAAGDLSQSLDAAEALDSRIDIEKLVLSSSQAAERSAAQERLKQARAGLADAQKRQDLAALQRHREVASAAAKALTGIVEEGRRQAQAAFERQFTGALQTASGEFAFVETALVRFEQLAMERPSFVQPGLVEQRDAVAKETRTLRAQLERAQKAQDVAAVNRVARRVGEMRSVVQALIEAFGPPTLRDRGVHEALEAGARAFLAGEYRQALAALDSGAGLREAPLQLHVHLLRAASYHALYVHSGGADTEARTKALAEIERCKQIDASFVPDSRAYSPAFLKVYREGTAAPAGPAR